MRSLDTDLAPADPVARAGAAQREQTIEAEGGKGMHLIPKETEAPERDTQALWLIGEANEPTLHS